MPLALLFVRGSLFATSGPYLNIELELQHSSNRMRYILVPPQTRNVVLELCPQLRWICASVSGSLRRNRDSVKADLSTFDQLCKWCVNFAAFDWCKSYIISQIEL